MITNVYNVLRHRFVNIIQLDRNVTNALLVSMEMQLRAHQMIAKNALVP